MNFQELLEKTNIERQQTSPEHLLAIDPGETTGYAVFSDGEYISDGEIKIRVHNLKQIWNLINSYKPDVVVCEDYIVYGGKVRMHAWNKLVTPQIIGVIRYTCQVLNITLYMQMASTAKGFCNDKKLKEWGLWVKGKDHARDSLRHACYWLLFGKRGEEK